MTTLQTLRALTAPHTIAAALIVIAGSAAIATAPIAVADTSTLPQCTDVAGDAVDGTATTECATPGNVQLDATPPVAMEPDYPYPYDDEFYGPALVFGSNGGGDHGGAGGHR